MSTDYRRSVSFTDSIKINRDSKDNVSKSENPSPSISNDTTPRSRSKETTPRSRENSPRKKLLQVVHKLTHKDEIPPHKHSSIYPIYNEYGKELGEFHYELFEYAMNGNIRGIKEVLDSGKYTEADILMVCDTAVKYNHPDTAHFVESIY